MDESEEMVKLLLAKAKMLSYHCPRCNLPLFEQGKKVVCVRCGGVRVEREDAKTSKSKDLPESGAANLLNQKKEDLLLRLKSEEDPKKIVSILEAISRIEQAQKDL
jgi:UPF0148 protein